MPKEFTPNWEMIQVSDLWKSQVKPFVEAMRQDGLEQRAGQFGAPLGGGQMPTLEEFHFWRGWCAALKAISEMPDEMVELDREKRAQETKDGLVSSQQTKPGDYRRNSA